MWTAVSEAVTNVIVHAYPGQRGNVYLSVTLKEDRVEVEVADRGRGIEELDKALLPFYTTCPGEERSGMGFTVMQTFMDQVAVSSVAGQGTRVHMVKVLGGGKK